MVFQILSEKDEKLGQLPTALFTETGGHSKFGSIR
jgi:hypothetical protein